MLAAVIGAWIGGSELVLILVVVLILCSARWLAAPRKNQDALEQARTNLSESLVLWLAQGFGIGRIPVAPGTFGSVVGLLWFLVLLRTGDFWFFLAGIALGMAAAVWLCGTAERILGQTDPPSIVLDEIAAVPLCFVVWVGATWFRTHWLPSPESFFASGRWLPTLIVFALFRLFDVLKPWPIRQSQKLPGGWGVTVDDLLAAVYVALVTLVFVG